MTAPTKTASPERYRWENYFRKMEAPQGGAWLVWVPLVIGILAIVSMDPAAVVVGIALVGLAMLVWRARRPGELDAVSQPEFDRAVCAAAQVGRRDALDKLGLARSGYGGPGGSTIDADGDRPSAPALVEACRVCGRQHASVVFDEVVEPEEEVLQSLLLVGGNWRAPIPGVQKTLTGVRPKPTSLWLPGAPSIDRDRFCFAAYWVHALFALEDAVAYYTVVYDLIDQQWTQQWQANKIYYRFIENVQMRHDRLVLRTVSGGEHSFILVGDDPPSLPSVRSDGGSPPTIDQRQFTEGQHFVSAVNQLRDEWERRQRANG